MNKNCCDKECQEMAKKIALSFLRNWWAMIPVGLLFMSGLCKGSVDTMLIASILAIVVYELHKIRKKIENCCWY